MGRHSSYTSRPRAHFLTVPRGWSSGTRRKGFTILELIVLLVILTVVASVGIPAYFGRPSVTLEGAAKLLANDLREVRNRAALYEEELWIRFDADGTGYLVTDGNGKPLLSPYGDGPFERHYPVDAVFRGVTIAEVQPSEPGCIVFSDHGMPFDSVVVTVEYRGEQREVAIRKRSGLVAIDGEVVE